ncbi:MAG: acyltransferase family protein [Erythrobacter sp.]
MATAAQGYVDPMKALSEQTRLADHLSGRDNNLNLIRVIAAAAVLVSHAFPITLGPGAEEPLEALTGMSLGAHAVAVFFVLSGLLIARSFDRGSSRLRFVMARVLRLFPALLVVLALTLIASIWFTTLSAADYFAATGTWTYVPRNLSLAFLQYELPGVFQDNPLGGAINGSLWTLFYEVICYVAVFALGLVGVLRQRGLFSALFLALAGAFVFSTVWEPQAGIAYRFDKLIQLGFPFALGTLFYVWRERVVLDWRIGAALWVLVFAATWSIALPLAITFAVGYTLLMVGFIPKGRLLSYNRLGDYSYGIYIYAFPVQQATVHLLPGISPAQNMAIAAPITVLCAVLSWHVIEERALAQVRPLTDRLAGLLRLSSGPTSETT